MDISMTVIADSLHIRVMPAGSSKSLGFFSRGEEVRVTGIDQTGTWGKVVLHGMEGWCNLKYMLPRHGKPAPWLAFACAEVGVREVDGKGSHPRIVEYMSTVDKLRQMEKHEDSSTSWCSCFMNWCVHKADIAGTNSAIAQSWKNWRNGKPSDCVLPGSPGAASPGDIAVWERVEPGGWQGHVAIFIAYDAMEDKLLALGGNQSDAVCYSWYPRQAASPYYSLLTLRSY